MIDYNFVSYVIGGDERGRATRKRDSLLLLFHNPERNRPLSQFPSARNVDDIETVAIRVYIKFSEAHSPRGTDKIRPAPRILPRPGPDARLRLARQNCHRCAH
jgi:hypothetical protein